MSFVIVIMLFESLKALTGGAVEIPTLDGRKISVPINEIVRWVYHTS